MSYRDKAFEADAVSALELNGWPVGTHLSAIAGLAVVCYGSDSESLMPELTGRVDHALLDWTLVRILRCWSRYRVGLRDPD